MAHVGVVVFVHVLVGMLCLHVISPPEVAQGSPLALSIWYAPSEVVSLVGGGALVNISAICLRAADFLSPNFVSGLVGVGLRSAWINSADACVATSCEDSLGKVSIAGKTYVVSDTLYYTVLGM